MPPTPWVTRDPVIERPFKTSDVPLVSEETQKRLTAYLRGSSPKALALGMHGQFAHANVKGKITNENEASRRALEICGRVSGVPCTVVAVDDVFVVPIPTKMKPVSFFRPANSSIIAAEERDNLAQRLQNSIGGWCAVAIGASGRAGLAVKKPEEQEAIDASLEDCRRKDTACRVIAIGPFSVEPF